ncbi:M20/M25/M40 family metallo-hydrolase [Romboutsia maritimum]|uniref:M20/M25/M40 family metallo-hydrolase n=1 Tax=Romboutsia maritimum TaxID=2020948 RepID=A0A371IX27_9FIRM|nr:M42 family metallopeptidase [Romboutsia maritimum]RDY25033.1 M20/M25/M40 family metallo-hydrolase [Romboutsia maritimum]
MYNKEIIKKYLIDLLQIPSPTGYTSKISNYIIKELEDMDIKHKVSNKGIIVASIEGNDNTYSTTFSAHIDTLGAIVKEIKSTGRLGINQIGGYMMNSIEGENCIIHTRDKKSYEGTVQTIKPSIHIHGNEAKDLPRDCKNYEIIIDEEVFSKEDVKNIGIEVGDIISFDTRVKITNSEFIKSRYLDDKASVAAMLYVMKFITLNNIKPNHNINFLFSNYEEVGHGSSTFIPKDTKNFIAVDMGCPGDGQNSTEFDVCICTKDSNGPYDYEFIDYLIKICKANNINYKLDIYPNYGSDATAALKSGLDAKFALIGPGVFASHGYERTHIKSIIETTKLIISYINN